MPAVDSHPHYSLKEYEPLLKKEARDGRDEEVDDTFDEIKGLFKKHLRGNRQYLLDNKYIDKDTRLTGYGKISDNHVHKESGKQLKEVMAEDLINELGLYVAKKAGHDDELIKTLKKGLGAKKTEKKDGKEVQLPLFDKRRVYHDTIKSILDGYLGQQGLSDALINTLKQEKNYQRALKGQLGEIFEKLAKNLHPGHRAIEGYQKRVKSNVVSGEEFRAAYEKMLNGRGYETNPKNRGSIDDLLARHEQMVVDSDWKPAKDDSIAVPKKKKAA